MSKNQQSNKISTMPNPKILNWILDMQAGRYTSAMVKKLVTWLAQNPKNVRDYEETESTLAMISELEQDPDVLECLAECDELIEHTRASVFSRRLISATKSYVFAASIATVTIMTGWLVFSQLPSNYETAQGEQRLVVLDDGSSITLNTNTHVKVKYSRNLRRIELLQGEAYFKVYRKPNRPFEVYAGEGLTRALGTEFNVMLRGEQVDVAVLEGTVEVDVNYSAKTSSKELPKLTSGKEVSYWPKGVIADVKKSDPTRINYWREGKLYFKSDRLADAVNEFNRYSKKKLVIYNDSLEEVLISGIFRVDDVDEFLHALNQGFGIGAEERENYVMLTLTPEE